uniref:Structural maintenance of chromosomes protein 6 n=1 Tax=Cyprinus carpio TaxID=7962 RepID=A0A8C1FWX9_CYPCA
MNKRKSCVHNAVKPSKTPRTDDPDVTKCYNDGSGLNNIYLVLFQSVGDIGVIESITLRNFMSHHLLGPFKFGPNVNFIVGNNGTGKSAILTALIVGLGGKATTTNRGTSLKGFVKYGESFADIKVKLKNRGNDPYKGDIYGDSICIEHRITSDGCRTCKIKNKIGHVISTKKEELTAILDHFGIQVDNPVSVLNQEMSKQFLHSKSEADKYKFFMKATLLEQMKRDYIHIKQTKALTREQVERQEECLKDLRQLFLQKKERYERLSSLDNMRQTLEDLKKKMAWCLVREKERHVEQLIEQIEKEESDCKHEEKLQLCQVCVISCVHLEFYWQNYVLLCYFKTMFWGCVFKLSLSCSPRLRLFDQKHGRRSHETEQAQHLKKISAFKKQLEKLEKESSALNQEIKDKQQALLKGREEYDKLSMEEKNIQVSLESKLKRKKQLMASRSNRLRRFGDQMPELLESIDKAFAQGRFIKKPVGPIGACISLKDPSFAVAVESCLRGFFKTFCCDNYRDEKVLQGLMSSYFPKGSRPQIMVCPFTDRVYNLQVHHPEFPSVLDCLNIENPVITNCLIDMRGIESILIIKEKACARKVMQGSRPPKNCREAFTADGDQVFSHRYYTPEHEVLVKYLGGDPEAEIRQVVTGYLSNVQEEDAQENEQKIELERRNVKEGKLNKLTRCAYCFHLNSSMAKYRTCSLCGNGLLLQDCEAKAKEICPVRQQVDQSARCIDAEITRLRQKISAEESSHGDKEQVIRYEQLCFQKSLPDSIGTPVLKVSVLNRVSRSLSVRCKLYFNNFMMQLNCCGSMMFNHINETLSISVKPPGQEKNNVNDMRSLSGGERSFSTVCFILALWEITESPFRCLDEFDVYMDMHNRSISMNMLVALSERQHLRQFIFITPQSTSHLPKSAHITIHQLQDPEREAEEE